MIPWVDFMTCWLIISVSIELGSCLGDLSNPTFLTRSIEIPMRKRRAFVTLSIDAHLRWAIAHVSLVWGAESKRELSNDYLKNRNWRVRDFLFFLIWQTFHIFSISDMLLICCFCCTFCIFWIFLILFLICIFFIVF